jgi:hypothetical protein
VGALLESALSQGDLPPFVCAVSLMEETMNTRMPGATADVGRISEVKTGWTA